MMQQIGTDIRRETHLRVCDTFGDLMKIMTTAVEALHGDGSTSTMPDVEPWQAAVWMIGALDEAGYRFVRIIDRPVEATTSHLVAAAPDDEGGWWACCQCDWTDGPFTSERGAEDASRAHVEAAGPDRKGNA